MASLADARAEGKAEGIRETVAKEERLALTAIAKAVREEREACAVLVEFASLEWDKMDPRVRIAAAIRARGGK